ncbi:hypothetical protein SDC9_127399 [bioreactor metagenome]|uniref:Type II secretion system protein GspF domain-containing protein n=1 Tax=bioreactor metagenome TaxID=1076179 RepID=A0A645CUH7_9ZZZZ
MLNQPIMLLTALAAAVSVGCAVLYVGRLLSGIELAKREELSARRLPILVRLLLPFTVLTRPLAADKGCAAWREMIAPRLWMAGLGEVLTPTDFIALRFVFLVVAVLLAGVGMFAAYAPVWMLLALLIALFPGMWVGSEIKKRHLAIMKALPNVLDLLTLSVESGRDLLSALRDILARRKPDPLGEELTRAFQEIQFGRKRTEALRAMAQRVRQTDLTAVVNALVQAEELGVSISQILRIQSDMQRNKRFSLAEKLANEASVKIIIPIILCILPAVFLILIGPFVTRISAFF